jgi:hypothetical protein
VWDVEVLDNCYGAGHIEFAGRVHEVELRVDVPEEQSRRHGRDLGGARLFQLDSLVRRAGLSPHPLAQSPENSPQSNSTDWGNIVKNLFVGNLDSEVTPEEIRRLFEAYGQVGQVHIIRDRDTGMPRFAFVEMTNDAEAEKAIKALNGSILRDRTLDVNYARPRPERPAA